MLTELENTISLIESIDIEVIAQEIIYELHDVIVSLVKLQMEKGVGGDDNPVRLYGLGYAPSTIEIKSEFGVGLGAEIRWVTNYMSGEFYNSLFLQQSGENFEILSSSPLYDKIIARSGKQLLQLNTVSRQILQEEYVIPMLQERLNNALRGI